MNRGEGIGGVSGEEIKDRDAQDYPRQTVRAMGMTLANSHSGHDNAGGREVDKTTPDR